MHGELLTVVRLCKNRKILNSRKVRLTAMVADHIPGESNGAASRQNAASGDRMVAGHFQSHTPSLPAARRLRPHRRTNAIEKPFQQRSRPNDHGAFPFTGLSLLVSAVSDAASSWKASSEGGAPTDCIMAS
jgi:hypothetical protein